VTELEWLLLDELRQHIYRTDRPGVGRAGDPGWHPCTCGWEGYWVDWHPHVATLLAAVIERGGSASELAALSRRLKQRSDALNRTSVENQELRQRIAGLEGG